MWIRVTGGQRTVWVEAEQCHRPNGTLAFAGGPITVPPPPDWFGFPAESTLRRACEEEVRASGFPLFEVRSMRATDRDVLDFYEKCAERGALTRKPEPQVGRVGPGFEAESDDHKFGIEVYGRNDLAFWTIQYCDKAFLRTIRPHRLLLVAQDGNTVQLRHPTFAADEFWAPIDAVRDTEPPSENRFRPPRRSTVLWSSLPEWVQFGSGFGTEGEITLQSDEQGSARWNAQLLTRFNGDPDRAFESSLDYLEGQGFDPSGTDRPERSYYVSVLQWGHSLNARIQSASGEGGRVSVLNTLGHVSLLVQYWPAEGIPPPKPPH
jgi:hypothetical protein